MKQAGILTFHHVTNYGAVLQAYALKQVCDDLGYETHIIDYWGDEVEESPSPIKNFVLSPHTKRDMLRCARGVLSYLGERKRWLGFETFRKRYLNESERCVNSFDIQNLGYDLYIAGSDQIWNYQITGDAFDPVFFLQFDTTANKIIYAASSQDVPFSPDMEVQFKDMLYKTTCPIGIREEKLAEYVQEVTGKTHPVVLDPTLLAGRDVMDRIPTPDIGLGNYILNYQIDANPNTDISVKSLEKRFCCPVYTMTVPRLGAVHGRKGAADPVEFLALLKGAKFLVTNSFHGIALSLLYEKDFYVYENSGVMTRIDSLLDLCHLPDRKVKMVCDIDEMNHIDYDIVRPILNKCRAASMSFLKSAI